MTDERFDAKQAEVILRDLLRPYTPYFHQEADIDEALELLAACVRPDKKIYLLKNRLEAVTELVQDTDGDWLPADSFDGLAGEIQWVLAVDEDNYILTKGEHERFLKAMDPDPAYFEAARAAAAQGKVPRRNQQSKAEAEESTGTPAASNQPLRNLVADLLGGVTADSKLVSAIIEKADNGEILTYKEAQALIKSEEA